MNDPRIIVALDFPDAASSNRLVSLLDPTLCRLKVGKELFTAEGPAFVSGLADRGFGVFLDLKFHDIPTTVAKACQAACKLGIWMLNVHASGGRAMMLAAREAVDREAEPPKLIAVTVLTSLDASALREIGINGDLPDHVMHLAHLTQDCGLDGVVCSAQEAPMLRRDFDSKFLLVTPGIRPAQTGLDDQSRVLTPTEALARGASYLVIGRPITQAPDPLAALMNIHNEISR